MHPDLPHSETYRSFYSSAVMLRIASALLECETTQLQMELFNLLINPTHHAFALGWHRDDIRADTQQDEEERRLSKDALGVQWNVPLYDDDCLFVVPGTHRRTRTKEEVQANFAKPPPPQVMSNTSTSTGAGAGVGVGVGVGKDDNNNSNSHFDGSWEIDPPNTLRVSLKAGDAVFYSQRLLHRASYLPTKQRATLHGCYGQVSSPSSSSSSVDTAGERARMILQHDVDWMKEEKFGQSIKDTTLYPLWVNLMDEYRGKRKEDFGYSLDG